MTAPASTVLNGYTFTPGARKACSPTKHSSPSTTPSSHAHPRPQVAGPADGGAPQADALPEVGVVVDDHPLEVGPGPHADVGAEHRVRRRGARRPRSGSSRRSRPGPTTLASGWISAPSPTWTPSPTSKPGTSTCTGRRGCPCGPAGRPRGCRRPPSSPRPRRRRAAGPAASSAGKTSRREVDRPVGGDVVEDLGLEHEDAGVDRVAEHLAPGRLLEEPLDRAVLLGDHDAELERVLDPHEPDRGQRLLVVVGLDDGAEVDVGEHVAGDHEEALVELGHGVADRAGGAERRLLGGVDHPHAVVGAVAEVGADVVGQEGHRDDDLVEAVLRSSRTMCSIIGSLTSGIIGLGTLDLRCCTSPVRCTGFR